MGLNLRGLALKNAVKLFAKLAYDRGFKDSAAGKLHNDEPVQLEIEAGFEKALQKLGGRL